MKDRNKALIDVLAQHFFKQTPAFFALSYFSLYLDYCYPKGGTGKLVEAMEAYIRDHGGEIRVLSRKDQGTTFEILLPSERRQTAKGK